MKSFAEGQYPHSGLTSEIIASAQAGHEDLRPGLAEVLYERAICIEFAERNINFVQQKVYEVKYKSRYIGDLIPDLIVDERVVVDLKVVEAFSDTHVDQMLGYLNITGLEIGLLINFKHSKLQIKRIAILKKYP
jgi:GxxExxY protein